MKFIVFGAGMMCHALAYDLARSPGVERVTVADENAERATRLSHRLGAGSAGDDSTLAPEVETGGGAPSVTTGSGTGEPE